MCRLVCGAHSLRPAIALHRAWGAAQPRHLLDALLDAASARIAEPVWASLLALSTLGRRHVLVIVYRPVRDIVIYYGKDLSECTARRILGLEFRV